MMQQILENVIIMKKSNLRIDNAFEIYYLTKVKINYGILIGRCDLVFCVRELALVGLGGAVDRLKSTERDGHALA